MDHVSDFTAFAREHGVDIDPARLVADKLQRCPVIGKPGRLDGAYVFHSDGRPAGYVENFVSGVKASWRADGKTRPITAAERFEAEQAKRARQAESDRAAADAAQRALSIWRANEPAGKFHPYLKKKGVEAFGLRQERGSLLVPCVRDGLLRTLQYIASDGQKRFMKGGNKRGGYHAIGSPPITCVVLAEGYATGASAHMATGLPVVIAFDAGNLLPVALAIRARFPAVRMIMGADNDASGRGLEAATEAASAVAGRVVTPPSLGDDFNDMAAADGLSAVRALIEGALA